MSKRHQASRRRAYGRRQHEVHEREVRRPELSIEALEGWVGRTDDAYRGLDLDLGGRFRFAVPD
jgi:hypothetical protein